MRRSILEKSVTEQNAGDYAVFCRQKDNRPFEQDIKNHAKIQSILRGKSELNLYIEDHSKNVAVGHSDLAKPYRSGTVNDLHIVPPQMRLFHATCKLSC